MSTHVESGEYADPETVDCSPTYVSAALATGFAVLAALTFSSRYTVGVGLLAAVLLSVSTLRGSRARVNMATLVLLGCVLVGGLGGATPGALVLGTLLALLAWDAGRYAMTIGAQLGRDADTVQLELAHSAMSTAIGVGGIGLGYATYLVVDNGQPVVALLLLLVGAAVLAGSLR